MKSLLLEGNVMPVLRGSYSEVTPYSLRRIASTFILAKVISVIQDTLFEFLWKLADQLEILGKKTRVRKWRIWTIILYCL